MVDTSGSLEDVGYDSQLSFMKEVIHGLDFQFGRTRVGYVTYGGNTQVVFPLDKYTSNDRRDLLNAIDIFEIQDGTNIAKAIDTVMRDVFVRERGDRDGVPNTLIMISDGEANREAGRTLTVAATAKSRGIEIITVGIGQYVNRDVINRLASSTDSVFNLAHRSQAETIARQVLDKLCI